MKVKLIAILIVGILLIAASSGFAKSINIHKAIEFGLKNSYSMKQQKYELEQSKNSLHSSFLALLPSAQYNISSSATDDSTNKNGYISLSETISSNDSRYFSIKNNLSSLKQKKIENEINRKNFIYDVISKYIDVIKTKKYLKISAQNVKQSQVDMMRTQTLFDNGKASSLDVEQAKISLSQTQIDSIRTAYDYENNVTDFCNFINISENEIGEFEDLDYEILDEGQPDFQNDKNLSIKSSLESLKQTRLSYFQNKLRFFPTLSFSMNKTLNWNETNIFDFNSSNPSSYSLSISYPLLNPLINYPSHKSSRLSLKISKLNLKNIKKEQNNDFSDQLKLFKQTKRNLELLKKQEKLTARHFNLIRQKYKLGKADLSDVESTRKNLFSDKYNTISVYYELILLQEKINQINNNKLLGRY